MAWHVVDSLRGFESSGSLDMDIGWSYDLEHEGDRRTISVIVSGGLRDAPDLPEDCRAAIRTHGRSAIDRVLARDAPPRYLLVTSTGITERHG